jgi:hypothetical protein
VQEELERYYLELKKAHEAPLPISRLAGSGFMKVDSVELGALADAPPHRHLDVRMRGLRTPHRDIAHLDLRVVEHFGRPGLAILLADGSTPPLGAWEPSGREGERAFMLLVPEDEPSRRRLASWATRDWCLLVDLVALVERELSTSAPHWRAVAARLRKQLSQLPPRLRYSRLDVVQADGEGSALDLTFGEVLFGSDFNDELRLRWRPLPGEVGRTPRLSILASSDADLPLAGWPVGSDGGAATSLVLPVGSGIDAAEKRRQWASMSIGDREFTLAVLDALPASAQHASPAALPNGMTRETLAQAAAALHREARRTIRWLYLRRLAAKLLRRMRGNADAQPDDLR